MNVSFSQLWGWESQDRGPGRFSGWWLFFLGGHFLAVSCILERGLVSPLLCIRTWIPLWIMTLFKPDHLPQFHLTWSLWDLYLHCYGYQQEANMHFITDMHACVCVCVDWCQVSSSIVLHLIFESKSLSEPGLIQLGYLESELQRVTWFYLLDTGTMDKDALPSFLLWVQGSEHRSSCWHELVEPSP